MKKRDSLNVLSINIECMGKHSLDDRQHLLGEVSEDTV